MEAPSWPSSRGAVPAVSALEVADRAFAASSPFDEGSEAAGMLDGAAGG
jgi:hypothetical protein